MKEFSENLKRAREAKGLTQAEVARKLGITPTAYNFYERGRNEIGDREPSFKNLLKLADILDVPINDFFDYRIDEFEYYKRLWNKVGFEVEVINKKFNSFDYNAVVVHNKNNPTAQDLTIPSKEQFIKFTKDLEKKCESFASTQFAAIIETMFMQEQNTI